ncbi:MAG: cardiolipin synthase [Planctomycetota bacterium]
MDLSKAAELLPYLASGAALAASLVTSMHAILYKRDPRAAVAWTGLIWLVPVIGPFLYVLFGINRIQRRAVRLRKKRRRLDAVDVHGGCTTERFLETLGPEHAHLVSLQRVGDGVVRRPLLDGNRVVPLVGGEEAYPEMLRAIEHAQRSVSLLVYIFQMDEVGRAFAGALAAAAARGVEVRVLLDDLGSGRLWGSPVRALRAAGVPAAAFLPVRVPWRTRYMNLRNHRKILVVDGRVGFTGGMNIRASHLLQRREGYREKDVHFRLEGPVVEHLQEAFVDDWAFTTGEVLKGAAWFPRPERAGSVMARGIPFDPGTGETLRWLIVAALAAARRSVRIVTPYFLPDQALIAALNVAALRGVEVEILIPQRSDNLLVDWATTATLWQILVGGCRLWRTPPPFDHSKLMVVDGAWTLLGSANLDPRSLRLNFEFNVECYDRTLAEAVEALVRARRAGAEPVTLKKVDARPLPVRLRDGVARLFSPYL